MRDDELDGVKVLMNSTFFVGAGTVGLAVLVSPSEEVRTIASLTAFLFPLGVLMGVSALWRLKAMREAK